MIFMFGVEQVKGLHNFMQTREFLSCVPFPPQMTEGIHLLYLRQTMTDMSCFILLITRTGKPSSWWISSVKYFHTDTDLGVGKQEGNSSFSMVFPAWSASFSLPEGRRCSPAPCLKHSDGHTLKSLRVPEGHSVGATFRIDWTHTCQPCHQPFSHPYGGAPVPSLSSVVNA